MAIKIGIFKTQKQALDAIEALQQEGFTENQLKVIAKDREHSRLLESETNVHTDEIQDIAETRDHMEDGIGIPAIGLAGTGVGTAGGVGVNSGGAGATYYGAGILAGDGILDDQTDMGDALHALGVTGSDAEKCRDALAEGCIVITAETDADQPSNFATNISRGDTAEAVYQRAGAERIL
ncbi:general stress protein [Paenibacillus nasutitermitis]|uniref:General stress protein 17M-like domain-containing protein n=1 Tax=Paenibacillus nasutitermitis TaxID=1652958 RepID=A0A916ZFR3_9BACL|nr:general stress protein [Paenibacillus nasutitermitis]GGD94574.1 hypothetical protein GCM10010911_61560 [Paenibacillus nasutitermitis]